MVWYYADRGSQRGPLSDEEFDALLKEGRLTRDTLVWKDGMENWTPLGELPQSSLIPSPPEDSITGPAAPAQDPTQPFQHSGLFRSDADIPCMQCGRTQNAQDLIIHGNIKLCRDCNTQMFGTGAAQGYQPPHSTPFGNPSVNPTPIQYPNAAAIEYPAIWRRVAAKFIDNIIIFMVQMAAVVLFKLDALLKYVSEAGKGWESTKEAAEQFTYETRYLVFTVMIFTVLYNTLLVRFYGASLGKMILSLRVIKADGTNPGFSQALVRAAIPILLQLPGQVMIGGSFISFVFMFILVYGYLAALFDNERKTLFDRIAGTRVWHS